MLVAGASHARPGGGGRCGAPERERDHSRPETATKGAPERWIEVLTNSEPLPPPPVGPSKIHILLHNRWWHSNATMTNGWAPLSYPSPCIFSTVDVAAPNAVTRDSNSSRNVQRTPNPFFPLHHDVLLAAIRELFLINGLLDARTLLLRHDAMDQPCHGRVSPMRSHVDVVPPEEQRRFTCAEEFLEFVIHQTLTKSECSNKSSPFKRNGEEESSSMCETTSFLGPIGSNNDKLDSVSSKRKVSDVDESFLHPVKRLCTDMVVDFPSHIVQLVQSNVVILHRARSKEDEEPPTSLDLQEFLRHPQQHHNNHQLRFALPPLLQTNINNELHLRQVARDLCTSIVHSHQLDSTLPIFLGYKSNKLIHRSKLLTIFADILFDVSHAMYAWVQTEKEMGYDGVESIKKALFDDRALKRIGGFEPTSLLPLALTVRQCRLHHMSWEEFALSPDGQRVLEIHHVEEESKMRYNEKLLEVGKRRRGRRGRALRNEKV